MQEAKEGQMGPETLPGLSLTLEWSLWGYGSVQLPLTKSNHDPCRASFPGTMPEGPSAHKCAPWQTVFAFWVIPSHAPGLLLALGEPYGMLDLKPGMVACKANALPVPAVLLLSPDTF